MQKYFELVGAVLILFFMGLVLWQSTDRVEAPIDAKQMEEEIIEEQDSLTNESDEYESPDSEFAIPEESQFACTMDAKMCPDGSYVGRTGPDCEFEACPVAEDRETSKSITCSPESKINQACTREYRPVCGITQIQCVTTPCDPIEETYSNACEACAQGNVDSYVEGSCEPEAIYAN
ncbi:hypothetical protein H6787_00040 [Candidatus Nomurabacteria bacterium]|nr:hypothetical protein [Candidatus Nomurabacteria bacterium]